MLRSQRGLRKGRSIERKRHARLKNLKSGRKCRTRRGKGSWRRAHCKINEEFQKKRRTGRSGVENRKVRRRKIKRKNRPDTPKEKPWKRRDKRKEKHDKQKRRARRPWWLGEGSSSNQS